VRTSLRVSIAFAGVAAAALAAHAATDDQVLVVCSPGSPGTTDAAQPRMDAFASTLSAKTGGTITAVYDPSDAGGAKRLESAGMALVSLPFFLEHEKDLGLHARLEAVQKGRPAHERWTLVAQKGRVAHADALAGFTIVSSSGFAPGFVRGAVGEGFGTIPATVKVTQSSQVLSALRRAANGEAVAVLLDGPQAASLTSLPFASKLEVVTTSPAWPAGLVVTVDARMPAKAWAPIQSALLGLASDHAGATALDGLQMERFTALDDQALAGARKAFGRAP
jgi:hypothetical protein